MRPVFYAISTMFLSCIAPAMAQAQDVCADYTMTTAQGLTVRGWSSESNLGAICVFAQLPQGLSVDINERGYFTQPSYAVPNCPKGHFDGERCYLRPAPKGEFIYANGFHAVPENGVCPYGMIYDGVNCFWERAAFGTSAFSEDGNWYTTPRPSCQEVRLAADGQPLDPLILGVFDGVVCRVADLPTLPTEALIVSINGQAFAASRQPE